MNNLFVSSLVVLTGLFATSAPAGWNLMTIPLGLATMFAYQLYRRTA